MLVLATFLFPQKLTQNNVFFKTDYLIQDIWREKSIISHDLFFL